MEEILSRIKTAIEFLKDGLPFKVGDLYLNINEDNILNVTGASQYIHLENITQQNALKELDEIKSIFEKMIFVSPELKKMVNGKKVKFNLDFDYGMGDIRICSEKDGIVTWQIELI
jgi:hypothetical protein